MSSNRGAGRGGRGGGSGFAGPPRGRGGGGDGGPSRGRGSGFSGGRGGPPPNFGAATVDARLAQSDVGDLTTKMAGLRVGIAKNTELPPRPGFGTAGRAIILRANHFPMGKFSNALYEYSVQITPASKVAGMTRRLFDLLDKVPAFAQHSSYTANDRGAKVISAKELPLSAGGTLDVPIKYFDEDETGPSAKANTYVLSLSFTTKYDTSVLKRYLNADPTLRDHEIGPVISAFQIILGKHAISAGAIRMGKSDGNSKTRYFFPSSEKARLDDFLVAWKGFSLSVRPTWKQLSVNINVATTAFYDEGPLALALEKLGRSGRQAQANAFFKGVKVKLTHVGHKKKIGRITSLKANEYKFAFQPRDATGPPQNISVAEYFKKQYNITLKNPNLPLIEFGMRPKTSFIPAELCYILPGQSFRGKLTGDQTRKMLDIAVLNPGSHQARIMETGVPSLGLNPLSATLKAFGIEVGSQMVILPARQLPGVSVEYRAKKKLTVNDGAWNLMGSKFYQGAAMGKVPVMLLSDGPDNNYQGKEDANLNRALKEFGSVCEKYGLNTQGLQWMPALVQLQPMAADPRREKGLAAINALMKGLPGKPPIILVIMSREDKIYELLKRELDLRYDTHTVCSIYTKFRDCKDQYFANLALKFNAKLGGVNHLATGVAIDKLRTQGTMLVGADVTHPGPSSVQGTPSIASVVATNDDTFSRYPASLRLQDSGTEMIAELDEMMIERFKAYQDRNKGVLPKNIVFVRDGVSEGQFRTVAEVELPQMRDACRRISPSKPYKPAITLLIAGKRHQTRFYATNEADADGKNNFNTKAGTVAEHGVTSVYLYDFFLQPHSALKGTARPTHYTFIVDEKGFSPDEIQSLLHSISIVARATRSVGLAAPAYYADLACEHARYYIQDLYVPDSSGSTVSGSQDRDEQASQMLVKARELWLNGPTGPVLKNSMFYL